MKPKPKKKFTAKELYNVGREVAISWAEHSARWEKSGYLNQECFKAIARYINRKLK